MKDRDHVLESLDNLLYEQNKQFSKQQYENLVFLCRKVKQTYMIEIIIGNINYIVGAFSLNNNIIDNICIFHNRPILKKIIYIGYNDNIFFFTYMDWTFKFEIGNCLIHINQDNNKDKKITMPVSDFDDHFIKTNVNQSQFILQKSYKK